MNDWDEDDGESWKGDDACDHDCFDDAVDDAIQLDMFAGLAMQALVHHCHNPSVLAGKDFDVHAAVKSYDIAEAMMEERERRRAKAEEDQT